MLTGDGQAHRLRCFAPCDHWRGCLAEAQRRGSDWADFCAHAGPDPKDWLNLTPDLWNGPADGCPAGYWKGLEPVIVDAGTAIRETQVAQYGPVVELLTSGDDDASRAQKLTDLVDAGLLGREAAGAIAAELRREATL